MRVKYLVQRNCIGVKMGTKVFKSEPDTESFERDLESFEKEMERKYSRNEGDLVVVMFRW